MKQSKKQLAQLKSQYAFACTQYVEYFCKKQEIDFDGWIADEIGGIASFSEQYFFNISDIVLDIDTEQPVGLILDWQSDGVDEHFNNENSQLINYKSYTMGLRYEHIKQQNNE